jgi:hypothetical protein
VIVVSEPRPRQCSLVTVQAAPHPPANPDHHRYAGDLGHRGNSYTFSPVGSDPDGSTLIY